MALAILFATAPSCTSEGSTLSVDLRTDLVPGIDISEVTTSLGGSPPMRVPVADDLDLVGGHRIAEFPSLSPGTYSLQALLDATRNDVLARRVVVTVNGDTGVTVVLTRDCIGVSCPASGDGSSEEACLAGTCVAPECVAEEPSACGDAVECVADVDCTSGVACADGICAGGACLFSGDDSSCMPVERCDAVRGCVPAMTPMMDSSVPDAAVDSSLPDAVADGCLAVDVCNGLDDDCDSSIDEGADCGPLCSVSVQGTTTYLLCNDPGPWAGARTACQALGYDLVQIDDDAENMVIGAETLRVGLAGADWWIGATDMASEGMWVWIVDGSPMVFEAWSPGQPDNFGGIENCAAISEFTPTWDDFACDMPIPYICEAAPPP